jgi:hypothetical protein
VPLAQRNDGAIDQRQNFKTSVEISAPPLSPLDQPNDCRAVVEPHVFEKVDQAASGVSVLSGKQRFAALMAPSPVRLAWLIPVGRMLRAAVLGAALACFYRRDDLLIGNGKKKVSRPRAAQGFEFLLVAARKPR